MFRRDKKSPQSSHRRTQDMQLVQALTETRRLAEGRTDDPGWQELHERTDRMLEVMGSVESGEPQEATFAGVDRIDRRGIQLDAEDADRVAASLMALSDRPDDRQVEQANETLRSVEEGLP